MRVRAKGLDLEVGARRIAEDFRLPGGGRKKIAKLVKDHWDWFKAAEARGMVVEGMLTMITAAGATYPNGGAIKFTTLSNAVWRRRSGQTSRREKRLASPKGRKAESGPADGANDVGRKPRDRVGKPTAPAGYSGRRAAAPSEGCGSKGTAPSSTSDVLGFMRRAAALRRPTRDAD